MQHLDFKPVQTERPGELTAYYKIARKSIFSFPVFGSLFERNIQLIHLSGHYKWALDQLFYKHNFSRVIILEGEMGYIFST